MNVTSLLLQHLFPDWSITLDREGIWRATSGPVRIAWPRPWAVLVTRVFDEPDLGRARALIDDLFSAGAGLPPADWLIAAHFYCSLDGSQVLNYALCTSAQDH
ncbi:hypothetical protein [Actinomadura montaniterrae]|uniref:Uncharacterized protein n=1 Tax=Actinomadura montaniterrae TaxID=1803903 RepID=A0A6L3WA90_9ACTN|nr:hypothetical protein [Actinomadura montaniterrae]KAB2390481.1 hypothetical protein F9B16_01230 [Actinomadura montaniterrae]